MRRKITYDASRDYYAILGIDHHATTGEVRQAYRRRVREVHPDRNPDRVAWATEQLKQVNEAYDVLGNALKRREYDRLRWPHIPHPAARGRPPSQRRTRAAPPFYADDRPWWERATAHSYPFGSPDATGQPGVMPRPAWLVISGWLKRHGLDALDRAWITLVGLWRSPYAALLAFLAALLAVNVAAIVYTALEPGTLDGWIAPDGAATVPASSATLDPTRDLLAQNCTDPHAKIAIPVSGDVVGDTFTVYGTVNAPDLWAYEVAIGYSGMVRQATEPESWVTVRAAPRNQSVPEAPVIAGVLTENPVDLTGQPPGYYAIRLRVSLRDGEVREPCDVIVLH